MSFMQHSHALKLDNLWVGGIPSGYSRRRLSEAAIKEADQVEAAALSSIRRYSDHGVGEGIESERYRDKRIEDNCPSFASSTPRD